MSDQDMGWVTAVIFCLIVAIEFVVMARSGDEPNDD